METENKSFTDYITSALRKAATEIEELQVQASLGKAEAKEKYEDYKKKFNSYIHEAKGKVDQGKEVFADMHQRFDELRVQLALGKAESLESFHEQKKKILLAIHEIEVKIKTNENVNRYYAALMIEIEKFKVQLEWLEDKFKEGSQNVAQAFQERKEDFKKFVSDMTEKYKHTKEEEDSSRWENFQSEISEAFGHVKKAFKP